MGGDGARKDVSRVEQAWGHRLEGSLPGPTARVMLAAPLEQL